MPVPETSVCKLRIAPRDSISVVANACSGVLTRSARPSITLLVASALRGPSAAVAFSTWMDHSVRV